MNRSADLERRYRRLLAFYPRTFRAENSDEILAVLLDCAQDGQTRPGPGAICGRCWSDWWRGRISGRLFRAAFDRCGMRRGT